MAALVVYYSRKGENHMPGGVQVLEKGNTEYAAEYIAQAVGAELFEIDTVTPYAENYRECCMQAVQEAKAKARPEIKSFVEDLAVYDTIFVCFPCWCGTAPMCVFTFLELYMIWPESGLRLFAPMKAAAWQIPRRISRKAARVHKFSPACLSVGIRQRTALM